MALQPDAMQVAVSVMQRFAQDLLVDLPGTVLAQKTLRPAAELGLGFRHQRPGCDGRIGTGFVPQEQQLRQQGLAEFVCQCAVPPGFGENRLQEVADARIDVAVKRLQLLAARRNPGAAPVELAIFTPLPLNRT